MKKISDLKDVSVLIVDDDQFLRSMYAAKFSARGAVVTVADTAEEALERLRGGFTPALVVFDIVMPGIDGYGFIETISKEKLIPDAAKVALSNQSTTEEIERVITLGANGFITKANATPSEIVEKILQMVS